MAKIRSLKGEFFRHAAISHGGLTTKVLAAGLITAVADDEGRFKAAPDYLRGEIFTHDQVTVEEVAAGLQHLRSVDFIQLYQDHSRAFGVIKNWKEHQPVPPSRFVASKLPAPPNTNGRRRHAGTQQTGRKQSREMSSSRAGVGSDRSGEDRSTPPSPSVSTAALRSAIENGKTEDLGLQLAVRVTELFKRDLSPLEVNMCGIALEEYAYLSPDDILDRMRDHIAWCEQNGKETPHGMSGFTNTLRVENEHRADSGQPKAWRPPPVVGDLTKLAAP